MVSPLPYLVQETSTRRRQPASLPADLVENAALRDLLPFAGRADDLALRQTRAGPCAKLLFDNPVLQFANLAARNAWFSGASNGTARPTGTACGTCSPVFAAVVETPRGPLMRLYEFERATTTTWQVSTYFSRPATTGCWLHVRPSSQRPRNPF